LINGEDALRALLVRGLQGDAGAYRDFLQALAGHLRAFLRRRLAGLPDDVEDLVQELLLAVHLQRHTYATAMPVTAWVYAMARYKLVDLLRRRSRTEAFNDPLDETDDTDSGLFASSETEALDARRDIGRLLQQLPDRQRLPILHVKLEGRSVAETAALTGMSESAVKVGIHRGLKKLSARVQGAH
jgi:RNA polymerase sigma-70 factor (ECF subfamily)